MFPKHAKAAVTRSRARNDLHDHSTRVLGAAASAVVALPEGGAGRRSSVVDGGPGGPGRRASVDGRRASVDGRRASVVDGGAAAPTGRRASFEGRGAPPPGRRTSVVHAFVSANEGARQLQSAVNRRASSIGGCGGGGGGGGRGRGRGDGGGDGGGALPHIEGDVFKIGVEKNPGSSGGVSNNGGGVGGGGGGSGDGCGGVGSGGGSGGGGGGKSRFARPLKPSYHLFRDSGLPSDPTPTSYSARGGESGQHGVCPPKLSPAGLKAAEKMERLLRAHASG